MISWILLTNTAPVSDSVWYFEQGANLAQGKGYTVDGIPTAYFPPGYSLFLGCVFRIFGISLTAGKIANLILMIGILYLSYYISKRVFSSEIVGRITLLTLSVYPNFISYSSVLSADVLFLSLLLLGIYLLLISKNNHIPKAAAGVIWGFMCLVKPQGFFIPIVLIFTFSYNSYGQVLLRLKSAVIIYSFILLTMLPWVVRNYYVFDEFFIVSTNDGINLLIGNNPYATGQYHMDDKVIAYLWDEDNLYSSPGSLVKNLPLSKKWTSYGYKNENIANKKFRVKAVDFILNNPAGEINLLRMKIWYYFKRGNEGIGWAVPDISKFSGFSKDFILTAKKAANYFYYLILFVSAIYIIISLFKVIVKKQKIFFPSFALWLMIYFFFITLVFFGGYRFNFPNIPWLAMFFGALVRDAVFRKND